MQSKGILSYVCINMSQSALYRHIHIIDTNNFTTVTEVMLAGYYCTRCKRLCERDGGVDFLRKKI